MNATEKPATLLAHFVQGWTKPNDLVVELGFGSGSLALVCMALGRNYVGFEQDATQVAHVIHRIQKFALFADNKFPLIQDVERAEQVAIEIDSVLQKDPPAVNSATKDQTVVAAILCPVCHKELSDLTAFCIQCNDRTHAACLENQVCDKRTCRAAVGLPCPNDEPEEDVADPVDDLMLSQPFYKEDDEIIPESQHSDGEALTTTSSEANPFEINAPATATPATTLESTNTPPVIMLSAKINGKRSIVNGSA